MRIRSGSLMLVMCAALLSCTQETPKAYLTPYLPTEKVQSNVEGFDPKVDILFVVDDSGSMMSHQNRLAANIDKFTSVFLKSSVLDYNIGVTTTTAEKGWGSDQCCGRLAGFTRVVTMQTPNADQVLGSNLRVGTNGDGYEKPFDGVKLALSEPNLSGWNKGFLRKDASLVVIFITDAEDQSKTSPAELYQLMLKLKGGDKYKLLAYGAFVPSNDTYNCERDDGSTKPYRLEGFLNMFLNNKSNVMNLCDPNFGAQLADLAKDIVNNSGRVILLPRTPERGSIVVTYGTMDLPQDFETGWYYDPARNAIILGDKIDWSAQPIGSKIKVYYNAYKYDE